MSKTKQANLFQQFPKQVERARVQAEKVAQQTFKQALDLLPPRSRKAIDDVTARVEKAGQDLQRRGERALKEVNARGRKLVATLELGAVQAVRPIVERLDVATRTDVERLTRRLTQLERKIQQGKRAAA